MTVTAYFKRADGAIISRSIEEVDGPIEVSIAAPVGAELIEEAEALAVMAEHRRQRDEQVARDRAERDEKRERAYVELVALGLEGELAAFLTGGGPR